MTIQIITFTAPTSWASALINGDISGMSKSEIVDINVCCQKLISEHGNALVCDCENIGFQSRGDFGTLMGDYSRYTITN